MTSTLSKPFANPRATLRDLGMVSSFMCETIGPDRDNAPPMSERARYARWTFGARVGELIADLAYYMDTETSSGPNDSKRLFLYADHPDDILADLIAVTGMVADFQRHANNEDHPETVNKAAAIILDWVADSLAEMKDAGVRYEASNEKRRSETVEEPEGTRLDRLLKAAREEANSKEAS